MTIAAKSSLARTRLVIVAGKGGVGKSVVSASLSVAAAATGRDVTLVEVEGKSHLSTLLGVRSAGYEPVEALSAADTGGGRVRVRTIGPDEALVEWLQHSGLGRIAKQLARSGALDVVATATPGIKDLLVLGRVKQMFNESDDLVIIDAPASGHALSFLRSPGGLADTARVGVINRQANEVLELLQDPASTVVALVGLADDTPVSELVETAHAIDELGIAVGPVVMNQLWVAPDGLRGKCSKGSSGSAQAARFVTQVVDRQQEAIALLREHDIEPAASIPYVDSEICRAEIIELAKNLEGLCR
jgi:anion-transporting  ArsA/GET3 family ATPase